MICGPENNHREKWTSLRRRVRQVKPFEQLHQRSGGQLIFSSQRAEGVVSTCPRPQSHPCVYFLSIMSISLVVWLIRNIGHVLMDEHKHILYQSWATQQIMSPVKRKHSYIYVFVFFVVWNVISRIHRIVRLGALLTSCLELISVFASCHSCQPSCCVYRCRFSLSSVKKQARSVLLSLWISGAIVWSFGFC